MRTRARLLLEALRDDNGDAPILASLLWSKLTGPVRRIKARARSAREWRRFQDRVAALRSEAVAKHAAVRPIDARQREIVHDALAGAVKR